ncbi:hypothetical protein DFH06DRAFT_1174150 [Mycena polygramma]|nr:hypothetical protein DFH06DRAFT_1174150 [Mycena polygramma]
MPYSPARSVPPSRLAVVPNATTTMNNQTLPESPLAVESSPPPAAVKTDTSDAASEEQSWEDEQLQCVLIQDDLVQHANTQGNRGPPFRRLLCIPSVARRPHLLLPTSSTRRPLSSLFPPSSSAVLCIPHCPPDSRALPSTSSASLAAPPNRTRPKGSRNTSSTLWSATGCAGKWRERRVRSRHRRCLSSFSLAGYSAMRTWCIASGMSQVWMVRMKYYSFATFIFTFASA